MSDEILKIFAKNVKKYRKLRKLSIEELSELTSIKAGYLKRIEEGTAKRISTKHLNKISFVLNIEAYRFFL